MAFDINALLAALGLGAKTGGAPGTTPTQMGGTGVGTPLWMQLNNVAKPSIAPYQPPAQNPNAQNPNDPSTWPGYAMQFMGKQPTPLFPNLLAPPPPAPAPPPPDPVFNAGTNDNPNRG